MRQKTHTAAHSKVPRSFDAAISVLTRNVRSAHIAKIEALVVFQAKELTSVSVYSRIKSTLSLQEELDRILPPLEPYMINSVNV